MADLELADISSESEEAPEPAAKKPKARAKATAKDVVCTCEMCLLSSAVRVQISLCQTLFLSGSSR
jgi:hypothetical protein